MSETMTDPLLHETHVCRDCGCEITLPYARPPSDPAAPLDVEALEAAITDLDTVAEMAEEGGDIPTEITVIQNRLRAALTPEAEA